MTRFKYSSAQLAFIETGYKRMGLSDLTTEFNQVYGLNKTPAQIKSTILNKGFTCGRKPGELNKGQFRLYTQEQADYLKQGYRQWEFKELTKRFNSHFGTSMTPSQIKGFIKAHGFKSGRTGRFEKGQTSWNMGTKGLIKPNSGSFQKGHCPVNHRPVGSERVNVEGYIEIKTAEPNVWDLKQRVVYEQNCGPIPKGNNVRFRDGNKRNVSLDNLFLVDNRENALLNKRYKMSNQPVEHRETIVLLAKIDVKVARLAE